MIFKLRLEVGWQRHRRGCKWKQKGPRMKGSGGSVVAQESTCAKGLGERGPKNGVGGEWAR